ncbi:MAG: acyltransferase family protein [Rhodanobacteraceae bacterium]
MQPTSGTRYRLGYRADIEGLRAIAILLVVACHAKVSWLSGGFVGVDVFYVLSGYLITGLLVQELLTTGQLRFANFYARRLRRLFPALLLMLVVCCVLARLLLPAIDQPEQASAAASAAVWLSNLHFAFSKLGYFSSGAETNLFLHTWSLGVEEQFYLLWPLLAALAMLAWRAAKHPPSSAGLKWFFGFVFVAGFLLSWYWSYSAPNLAFYMMPSRAWQFALGAMTFMMVGAPAFRPVAPESKGIWRVVSGWLGLGMILLAASLIDGNVTYPGTWALLPSVGAALVLASGPQSGTSGVGRLLSLRPMQMIGRVSYAWYLWHWPALLLGATLLDTQSPWVRLLLVGISLLVAALSYHLVETPIRHNRKLLARPRLAVLAGVAVMALAGSLTLRWHQSAMRRMESPAQSVYAAARDDAPAIYPMGCDNWYYSSRLNVCGFGEKNGQHTAVVIGDSVALQWFPAYQRIFDRPGWRLLVVTKSSCPMVDAPIFYAKVGGIFKTCAKWRHKAIQAIATLEPDIVILGSSYTYDYSRTQWVEGTRHVLRALNGSAKRIYLMRSTPALPFNGPSCLAPRSWLYSALSTKTVCASPANSSRNDRVYHWLQDAAGSFDKVRTVDMIDHVCPNGVCHAKLDGQIVFRDDQHMTASFAASLAPVLARAFGFELPSPPQAANSTAK